LFDGVLFGFRMEMKIKANEREREREREREINGLEESLKHKKQVSES